MVAKVKNQPVDSFNATCQRIGLLGYCIRCERGGEGGAAQQLRQVLAVDPKLPVVPTPIRPVYKLLDLLVARLSHHSLRCPTVANSANNPRDGIHPVHRAVAGVSRAVSKRRARHRH